VFLVVFVAVALLDYRTGE